MDDAQKQNWLAQEKFWQAQHENHVQHCKVQQLMWYVVMLGIIGTVGIAIFKLF